MTASERALLPRRVEVHLPCIIVTETVMAPTSVVARKAAAREKARIATASAARMVNMVIAALAPMDHPEAGRVRMATGVLALAALQVMVRVPVPGRAMKVVVREVSMLIVAPAPMVRLLPVVPALMLDLAAKVPAQMVIAVLVKAVRGLMAHPQRQQADLVRMPRRLLVRLLPARKT